MTKSDSMVDSDSDELDDRLVDVGGPDAEDLDFSSLLNRVENVRIVNLPPEMLDDMHNDIVEEQDKIKHEWAELEIKLHKNLIRGNASFYEEARKECR